MVKSYYVMIGLYNESKVMGSCVAYNISEAINIFMKDMHVHRIELVINVGQAPANTHIGIRGSGKYV